MVGKFSIEIWLQYFISMFIFCISNHLDWNFTFIAVLGGASFAEAFLEVKEEQDYPPTTNAGEDMIIHLLKNQVTLHGNGSTDDHGMLKYDF